MPRSLPSRSGTVYVGIVVPAVDSIRKAERVECVFASREKAKAWAAERPPTQNGSYRRVEDHEVVR